MLSDWNITKNVPRHYYLLSIIGDNYGLLVFLTDTVFVVFRYVTSNEKSEI